MIPLCCFIIWGLISLREEVKSINNPVVAHEMELAKKYNLFRLVFGLKWLWSV